MRTSPGCSGSLPATGWSSSSPKWRANATCSARLMPWRRKKRTRCFINSARISATSPTSRDAAPRSTLRSSAPIAHVSGSTWIEPRLAARTTAVAVGVETAMARNLLSWPRKRPSGSEIRDRGRRLPPLRRGGREGAPPAPSRLDGLEQPQDVRARDDLFARPGVELGEQVLDVPLDGLFADLHRAADLLVGEVACEQLEHLALLRSQRHARRRSRPRRVARRRRRAHRRRERPGRAGSAEHLARPAVELGVAVGEDALPAVRPP